MKLSGNIRSITDKVFRPDLVIDGMVATMPAHAYIMGIKVLGLFFRSHIKEPNAARDMLNTCIRMKQKINNETRVIILQMQEISLKLYYPIIQVTLTQSFTF